MKINYFLLLLITITQSCKTQKNLNPESVKSTFLQEQKEFGSPIFNYLNNNFYILNSLNDSEFTSKIDSLKAIYTMHLKSYKRKLDRETYNNESIGIDAAFDKYILEYPQNHEYFTGKKIVLSKKNQSRLSEILKNFNDTSLLSNKDLKEYVKSYISIESRNKLEKHIYKKQDNQQLITDWNTIDSTFTNQEVIDYWKQEYLFTHIDKMGIKNIDNLYNDFINSCKSPEYITKLSEIYESHKKGRESHTIKTYKRVNGFELEMHLFLPDTTIFKGNRPTLVYFHGGSWSEGKPDRFWLYQTAQEYAKKGWIATAVEYRIKGKQGTFPFESVKDAKSAIRWLRENAEKYKVDTNNIVVTGSSAGGHLAIATTLVDNWNEKTDNLNISSVPNVILVNSAVYDLTVNNAKWITEYNENKKLVKEISPNHLIKKVKTKMLLIHGEKDRNCSYESATNFYDEMKLLGNDIELHTIKGASHWIWLGRYYPEVAKITSNYIKNLNLE
jgi:acetyl esterase/lipase